MLATGKLPPDAIPGVCLLLETETETNETDPRALMEY